VQVVIALIVTPEGFPLAYEVLPGNTSDKTTLRGFLSKIEARPMAAGLTPRAVLDKLAGIQMLDVHSPPPTVEP
jgi:transposase